MLSNLFIYYDEFFMKCLIMLSFSIPRSEKYSSVFSGNNLKSFAFLHMHMFVSFVNPYQKPVKNSHLLEIVISHISDNIPQGHNMKCEKIHIHDDVHHKFITTRKLKIVQLRNVDW